MTLMPQQPRRVEVIPVGESAAAKREAINAGNGGAKFDFALIATVKASTAGTTMAPAGRHAGSPAQFRRRGTHRSAPRSKGSSSRTRPGGPVLGRARLLKSALPLLRRSAHPAQPRYARPAGHDRPALRTRPSCLRTRPSCLRTRPSCPADTAGSPGGAGSSWGAGTGRRGCPGCRTTHQAPGLVGRTSNTKARIVRRKCRRSGPSHPPRRTAAGRAASAGPYAPFR